MVQTIFLLVAVGHLVKLAKVNSAGIELGLAGNVFANWRNYRRKQYLCMIAAGWSSAAVIILMLFALVVSAGASSEVNPDDAFVVRVVGSLVGLVVILVGHALSSKWGKAADAIEAEQAHLVQGRLDVASWVNNKGESQLPSATSLLGLGADVRPAYRRG